MRNKPWDAMFHLGVLAKLVRVVRAYMQNLRCKIKFNLVISEEFVVNIDLRQRCTILNYIQHYTGVGHKWEVLQNKLMGLNAEQ